MYRQTGTVFCSDADGAFGDVCADLLQRGHTVRFRASGQSMHPTIRDGALLTVAPIAPSAVKRGDVLLYRSNRGVIAHRVVCIKHGVVDAMTPSAACGQQTLFVLRGDASSTCDAPVEAGQVLGRVVSVERHGHHRVLHGRRAAVWRALQRYSANLKRRAWARIARLCTFTSLLLALLWPALAPGQGISFDAASTSSGGDVTAESWSHTVTSSGSNRLLLVGVAYLGAPPASGGDTDVSSVTYNSVALTRVGTVSQATNVTTQLWGLVNPATGTNTLTVTLSKQAKTRAGAASFLNVHQTTPLGSFVSATGVSTAPSGSVASVAEGELVIDALGVKTGSNTSATVEPGQTQHWNQPFSTDVRTAGSTEPGPDGGGTVTMSWTLGSNVEWAIGAVALKPANATVVKMSSFTATHAEGGVLLQWRTGYEVDNLGFHVYREVNGQRRRLTPELVAGSAFFAGPATTLTAGQTYAWWDKAALPTGTYWLEDVDLNGQRTWHGPVIPTPASQPLTIPPPAVRLPELGKSSTTVPQAEMTAPTARAVHASSGPRLPAVARRTEAPGQSPPPWEATEPPPAAVQRALAAAPAVQLAIREAGWYRVTQPELLAAGLEPAVDPRRLQLFVNGQQQRLVVTGEADGRFDPPDAIEFYGVGLDTPWSDTQTYWLVEGAQRGKRVRVVPSAAGERAPSSFPLSVAHQERMVYVAAIKNGAAENFFGAVLATAPVEQKLWLHHLDPGAPADARLQVVLQGVTAGAHQTILQYNGRPVSTPVFAGQTRQVVEVAIPHAWLRRGENVVTLVPTGNDTDVSVVESLRLTYWHTYTADNNALHFTVPGRQEVTIGGFQSRAIRVLDITHPQAVQELQGRITSRGTRSTITVTAPRPGLRTLLAVTPAQVKRPVAITANTPSRWHAWSPGADLVILSTGEFLERLEPLKARRQAQGWAVALLDVQDLYDEFSFGAKTPRALKAFLRWAHTTWQQPPRFVLLVGDASFDPRNYLGQGHSDLVPTQFVETAWMETASDDWLADFDHDGVPELAVGRLPVRTAAEATTVVNKLLGYAASPPGGSWGHRVLLVTDNHDSDDFATASTAVNALLPATLNVDTLALGQTTATQARSALLAHLNAGQLLINYMGHGSVAVWASEGLLTAADAQALTNGSRLPVVVAMTCLNGFFHDLSTTSLAEALLTAEHGGAVAVWASSGLTTPAGQAILNQELVRQLFGAERLTLGEAMVRAKAAVGDRDVRRTWILFGDPTLRLE